MSTQPNSATGGRRKETARGAAVADRSNRPSGRGRRRRTLPRVPVNAILDELAATYPDAHCELNHSTPFELLVATILSAQCTDKRVNEVTADLFPKYNTPEAFARLTRAQLEEEIRGLGLFRNKAKSIIAASQAILDRHDGEVPGTMEELVALPGVGRKTANVVVSNAFGVPAIAVDTHVFRVANRLGLAESDRVDETEEQLMRRVPKSLWTATHHRLIFHGRRICHARNPKCTDCPLLPYCRTGRKLTNPRSSKAQTNAKS